MKTVVAKSLRSRGLNFVHDFAGFIIVDLQVYFIKVLYNLILMTYSQNRMVFPFDGSFISPIIRLLSGLKVQSKLLVLQVSQSKRLILTFPFGVSMPLN
jgi:hypothetical protein